MREGQGKWVQNNGVVYQGILFCNLAQVPLKKILNMALESNSISPAKDMKASFSMESELKGNCLIKTPNPFRSKQNEIFIFFLFSTILFLINA